MPILILPTSHAKRRLTYVIISDGESISDEDDKIGVLN